MGKSKLRDDKERNSAIFFLFLLPSLFAFVIVIVVPFLMGIYYSFTDWRGLVGAEVVWTGFANYRAVLTDITFLHAFLVTVLYAVLNIIVVNVVAFSLALLVTGKLRFTGVYRAGFFMPNLIGGLILGYIWQFIFNNAIPYFGKFIGLTWFAENQFLADRTLALIAIVLVGTWQYAGYIMMIYVASIQGVPPSLMEAAEIDGANYLQVLKNILFPLIAPAFTVSMFLTLTNSFKQFDVNYALTQGGPSGMFMGRALMTNEFLALNIYQTAFAYRQMAQGQAKAIVFFLVLAIVSLVQVYYNKRKEIEM